MPYPQYSSCTRAEIIVDPHLVSTGGLAPNCMHHLPTTEQPECQFYDFQDATATTTPEKDFSRSYISPALVNGSEISTYTENSDIIESDCSPDDVTHSYKYMAWRQHLNNDSVLTPNKTLPSTPELPVCESSDLLDIPYASLFDLLDVQDSVVKMPSQMTVFRENIHSSSDTMSPKLSAFPDLPSSKALRHSELVSTSYTVSPARFRQTVPINSHVKQSDYGSEMAPFPHGTFDEATGVCPLSKSPKDVSDSGDENNNSHFRTTDVDYELESETGVDTRGRSLLENSEDDFQYQSERSSMLRADTELSTLPRSSEGNSTVLSSPSATASPSRKESSFLGLAYGETLQADGELAMQSTAPSAGGFIITERRLGITSGSLSWSDCELSSKLQDSVVSHSVSETDVPLSLRDASWSYHNLPDAQQNTPTSHGERDIDHYVTVRAKRPLTASMELTDAGTGSSATCRRGNDGAAISVSTSHHGRSVKHRLPFKSPLKATSVGHLTTVSDISDTASHTSSPAKTVPYMGCSGKYKPGLHVPKQGHCRLDVRISQRKPPADQDFRRKPLARLARHGNKIVPAESTRYLSISSDKDSDVCETSQDTFQHSRKDYKHRAGVYILRDPATNEILERHVEGAENIPPSIVFPMHRQTRQVFRTSNHTQRQNFQHYSYSKKVSKQTRGRTGLSKRKLDRSSTLRTCTTKLTGHVRDASSGYHRSHHTNEPGRLKESTTTATSKSHRTHPIACSTLIRDDSSRTTDSDVENISTWTRSEESNFCNFQKSNLCSTRINNNHQANHGNKLNAVLESITIDTSTSSFDYQPRGKVFEISSIVSQIDKKLNHSRPTSNTEMRNMRKDNTPNRFNLSDVTEDASSDYTFSAAQSPSQTVSTSNSCGTLQFLDTYKRQCSASASEQTTPSSMFSNQATASTSCTPSEDQSIPEASHWSYECKHFGARPEDSVMHCQNYEDTDDLQTTPTSEDRLDIHNKHNTSDDSSCSAARCRPRHSNQQPKKSLSSECSSQFSQIFNSVLTSSPKSVTLSGILAPDNSSSIMHNEHAGFYDYYRNVNNNPLPDLQSFGPGAPTDYLTFQPKVSGPTYYMISTGENFSHFAAECQTKATRNIGTCYHPLTSVSDAKCLVTQQSLANHQSQPASSVVPTSCESTSVIKDHLNNKSRFVMPTSVVNGPSKIKNKNSLGQKLRKLRNNVYRKTKKLTHLHICE